MARKDEDKLRASGTAKFTSDKERGVGEGTRKITPDKTGKGQHKVEETDRDDQTKPPTDKK